MSERQPRLVRLPEELDREFRAFKEALHGATFQQVMVDALRLLIRTKLDRNPGIKEEFQEALRKQQKDDDRPLKVMRDEPHTA